MTGRTGSSLGRVALALGALLVGRGGWAQEREARPLQPRNVVTWQPLSLLAGYWDLEYERALGRRFSVYAAPGAVFFTGHHLDGSSYAGVYGWSLDVGARWFPWGDAPSGFFIDASGGYFTSQIGSLGDRLQGAGERGMLLAGYTLILRGHLVLSVGLGGQVQNFRRDGGLAAHADLYPAMRVALGGAF